ncbi:DDE-type integrase/transposase/recombinase [Mesorhizobium sp. B283B1A]|uniref:DDE-type integrase/transposase/recombinase n=1 Tax=Mesorhizobium TaxID=68287 RepID=UPI001CD0449A|nr:MULTISPECIES: DDE-type integrase/transposase/recombinase [Mesorhizobium]MCA0048278.1 DDE-type integrase/transposase/recombinase [Mesorhizobium sp. B283B1A]UQS64515.1 DDE-type integrase/transposase/recombinase [Mesorhizobium opportunistum]
MTAGHDDPRDLSIDQLCTAGRSLLAPASGALQRPQRIVTGKWHMDETSIKIHGQWMCLYRAVDGSATRSSTSSATAPPTGSQALLPEAAQERPGRPDRIVIDSSPSNLEAIISCDAEHRLRNPPRSHPLAARHRPTVVYSTETCAQSCRKIHT